MYDVPVATNDQEAGALAANSCTATSALYIPTPQWVTTEELPVEVTVPYQICRTCASLSSTNTEPALDHVDTPPPVTDVTECGQPSLMMVATSRSPLCWGETATPSDVCPPEYPEWMAGDPMAYTASDPALPLNADGVALLPGGFGGAVVEVRCRPSVSSFLVVRATVVGPEGAAGTDVDVGTGVVWGGVARSPVAAGSSKPEAARAGPSVAATGSKPEPAMLEASSKVVEGSLNASERAAIRALASELDLGGEAGVT